VTDETETDPEDDLHWSEDDWMLTYDDFRARQISAAECASIWSEKIIDPTSDCSLPGWVSKTFDEMTHAGVTWQQFSEYGTNHKLHEFEDDVEDRDDDALVATEVADRVTHDDPFSNDNFGPWELVGGDEVDVTLVSAEPSRFW